MNLTVDLAVQRGDQFLFIRRKFPPFADELAFPGGFVDKHETTQEAAVRELREETGITIDERKLRLFGVFSHPNRDPRGRIVSVGYHVVVPRETKAIAADDAAAVLWMSKAEIEAQHEELAFDHRTILESI